MGREEKELARGKEIPMITKLSWKILKKERKNHIVCFKTTWASEVFLFQI